MPTTLHGRALERAAELLGGEDALADYLDVSETRLRLYLQGTASCPSHVCRKVVAILADDPSGLEGASPRRR